MVPPIDEVRADISPSAPVGKCHPAGQISPFAISDVVLPLPAVAVYQLYNLPASTLERLYDNTFSMHSSSFSEHHVFVSLILDRNSEEGLLVFEAVIFAILKSVRRFSIVQQLPSSSFATAYVSLSR